MPVKFILTILIVFAFVFDSYCQTDNDKALKGIELIYHLKFDSAQIIFDEMILYEPQNPSGYFFSAMVDWWKINLNRDNDSLDEKFFERVDRVIEISDKRIEANESDDNAMFYKGGALGYRGLVRSFRESWLKAAEDGKEALDLLQRAYEINSNNKDVTFGIGLYNYFAEYIPDAYPVVKPLMLIFPKGDKVKGMSQIKETSQNSKYARTEANYALAYLNLIYEKNFTEAETYSKLLHEQFPENPIFEKYLCNSYVGQGKYNEALTGWKKILIKIDSNQTGYENKNLQREANYYSALCLMKMDRIAEAEKYLEKAEDITKQIDEENESAYTAFIYLLSGMMNDVKNNKSTADYYYDKVLSMKNFQNSHAEAEKFKKEGYKE